MLMHSMWNGWPPCHSHYLTRFIFFWPHWYSCSMRLCHSHSSPPWLTLSVTFGFQNLSLPCLSSLPHSTHISCPMTITALQLYLTPVLESGKSLLTGWWLAFSPLSNLPDHKLQHKDPLWGFGMTHSYVDYRAGRASGWCLQAFMGDELVVGNK